MAKPKVTYRPQWGPDRMISLAAAVFCAVLVGILIYRNEKIIDPELSIALRVLLALSVATLGATLPGHLGLEWNAVGMPIKAGGALALFVIVLVFPRERLAICPDVTGTWDRKESKQVFHVRQSLCRLEGTLDTDEGYYHQITGVWAEDRFVTTVKRITKKDGVPPDIRDCEVNLYGTMHKTGTDNIDWIIERTSGACGEKVNSHDFGYLVKRKVPKI